MLKAPMKGNKKTTTILKLNFRVYDCRKLEGRKNPKKE